MAPMTVFMTRLGIQIMLLLVFAVVVPVVFALAWLREAWIDLTRHV